MENRADTILKPIVAGWLAKLVLAKEAKKEFNDVAEQCMTFFDSTSRTFWDARFQKKFFGTTIKSPFKFSMGKAFELVSVVGPYLYHKNPYRAVKAYDPLQYGPELFGISAEPPQPPPPEAQQDPAAVYQYQMQAQIYQQQVGQYQAQMQQEGLEASRNKLRCELMERYLSFTPREQPAGGLKTAARKAIGEALVKGRGLLWSESYRNPGSRAKLTGCFYDTVDNLVIDPDATSADFGEARWIARKHRQPLWVVERKFGLKRGALKDNGTHEGSDARGQNRANRDAIGNAASGKTYDELEYWEIWSIGGVGTRLTGVTHNLSEAFDDVVGDFAYIVVAKGIDYPLNAPPAKAVANPADSFESWGDDEVQEAFDWPVPYYKDRKWPVAMLDFYFVPHNDEKPRRSAWPMAPLGPAVAELAALNIIVSGLVNAVHEGSRTFMALAESMAKDFDKMLAVDGPFGKIVIPDKFMGEGKSLKDLVDFLRAPDQSKDILAVIELLLNLIEHRTPLSEILYSMNPGGAMSRSATDAASKSEKAAVRPEDLSARVAEWLTEAAELEKLCAYWDGPKGEDLAPFFGTTGAAFWDQLVVNEPPETVFYGMRCTVEASDVRKPNRERDAQNMGQLYPAVSQVFMGAGAFGPMNELNKMMFKSIDQAWNPGLELLPPPQPQGPSPEEMKLQLEQQKMRGEMELKRAELEGKQAETGMKLQSQQAKMEMDAQAAKQKMAMEAQTAQMKMGMDAAQREQEMQHKTQASRIDLMGTMLGLQQKQAEGAVKLDSTQKLSNEKIRLKQVEAKMKAKAKPKPTGATK